jgi:anti-anti-sigma regulatory factor
VTGGVRPQPDRCDARVSTELRDGVLVVRGEIDAVGAATLVATLRATGAPPGGHRIDLTDVGFIDSRGIEALFDLADEGLEITVAPASLIERILHTVAMDQVARIRTGS